MLPGATFHVRIPILSEVANLDSGTTPCRCRRPRSAARPPSTSGAGAERGAGGVTLSVGALADLLVEAWAILDRDKSGKMGSIELLKASEVVRSLMGLPADIKRADGSRELNKVLRSSTPTRVAPGRVLPRLQPGAGALARGDGRHRRADAGGHKEQLLGCSASRAPRGRRRYRLLARGPAARSAATCSSREEGRGPARAPPFAFGASLADAKRVCVCVVCVCCHDFRGRGCTVFEKHDCPMCYHDGAIGISAVKVDPQTAPAYRTARPSARSAWPSSAKTRCGRPPRPSRGSPRIPSSGLSGGATSAPSVEKAWKRPLLSSAWHVPWPSFHRMDPRGRAASSGRPAGRG